ncbi:uncharacterized protein LOC112342300 [Selaginella moellendorffii]|uniref:uncharacterized protein LOC112342300 n=1 Tax=Selaginella moellendorffii TaxID=88036 RepID=UPI000D1CDC05|nr:uncharacterized protein LOC112342300 [Selaginella moellendorffii]|eukprot:XP_024519649.1 uncharacterized protein LOC112342300 [Selaginella moellendorffii]
MAILAAQDREFSDAVESGTSNQEKEVEVLQAELKVLPLRASDSELTILTLRSQLAQKTEQLSFLTDEKVVSEEALEASQRECSQLTSLIKELDANIGDLTSALATRTEERDSAISCENKELEIRVASEVKLQEKCKNLECQLQALQTEHTKLRNYAEDCKNEECRKKLILAASASEIQEYQ